MGVCVVTLNYIQQFVSVCRVQNLDAHLSICSCHFLLQFLSLQLVLGLLVEMPQHDGVLVAQRAQFCLLLLQLREDLVGLISTAACTTLLLVIVRAEDSCAINHKLR